MPNTQIAMATEKLDHWELMQAFRELLDEELDVLFFQPGWDFSTGFRAKLALVDGVPPGGGAIALDFDGPNQLTIGPSDVTAYRGPLYQEGSGACWLELQLGFGGVVWIEQVEGERSL